MWTIGILCIGVVSCLQRLFLLLDEINQHRLVMARHGQFAIFQRLIRKNPFANPVAYGLKEGLATGNALPEFPKHAVEQSPFRVVVAECVAQGIKVAFSGLQRPAASRRPEPGTTQMAIARRVTKPGRIRHRRS